MTLSPDVMEKLIRGADGKPVADVIHDACEFITLKAVMLLSAKRKAIETRRKGLPLGDPEANVLAAQMRALGEAIVELGEAP